MAQGYRGEYLEILNSKQPDERGLLNIILGNAYGGKDMTAVADALLRRFPGVSAILDAEIEELLSVRGVTESVAAYLKTLDRARKFSEREEIFINGTSECLEVARARFRGEQNECLELFFVNKSGKVIKIKRYTSDLPDKVEVSASVLLSELSSSGAHGLYVAHNHVNITAKPSPDDNNVTEKLLTACAICKINFFDHCIVSSNGEKFSYLESGLLKKLKDKS